MLKPVRLLTVALLIGCIASTPASSQQNQRAGITVSGVVTDEWTGEGIPQVQVYIDGTELGTLTDDQGRYQVRGVPNQNMTVVAQRLGYVTERREIWVCRPVHPGHRCRPTSVLDQLLRFSLRQAPSPAEAWLIDSPSNR